MSSQVPRSLVLRQRCCAYCGSVDDDQIGVTLIWWMFGLYRCTDHKADAVRDCNAYCHTNEIVDMRKAQNMPILAALFAELEGSPFRVLRSSGVMEDNWVLHYGSHTSPAFLANDEKRGWHIPVVNPDGLTKTVPITSIAKETPAMLACIMALEAGVYAEDSRQVSLLVSGPESLATPGV